MIRVSRKTSVADTAAKARRIVESDGMTLLTGDPRYLRKVRDALTGVVGLETLLGQDGDDVVLAIQPAAGDVGAIYRERVPRP